MSDESGNNFGIVIIGALANIFLGVSVEMSLALQNQCIIKVVVVLCAGISCFLILYSARKKKVISPKKKTLLDLLAAFLFGCALATYIVGLILGNNGDRVTGGNQTASIAPTLADTPSPIPTLEPEPTNTPTPEPTNTPTPKPTNTPTPKPTNTPKPKPTNTPTPKPTNTPKPKPTNTPTPKPTNTPKPKPTNTPTPKPTNTPIPVTCIVTFDPKGGSSIAAQVVNQGNVLSNLPVPQRDYYEFTGWTYNNNKITSIAVIKDMTLVATWEEKEKSDWVKVSDVPSSAKITDTKWKYTLTETTESSQSNLIGWIYNGYRIEVVDEGTFEYATFPSGFDTASSIYKEMYTSKGAVPVASGVEREIVSDSLAGYVYWHYAYPLREPNNAGNRLIAKKYHLWIDGCGYTDIFCAFKSNKNYDNKTIGKYTGETVYKIQDTHTSYEESGGSYWWLRFEYYSCTYRDTKKVYQYFRTSEQESPTEVVNRDGISNVEKWVRYRKK